MFIKLKHGHHSEHIKPDRAYPVFAIYIGSTSDFLVMGESHSFPVSMNIREIDILDNRLSKYWEYGCYDSDKWSTILSFREWSSDSYFYQNLVEGNENAREALLKYQAKIENEYADNSLNESAIKLNDEWYQCPFCDDSWTDTEESEVLVCPRCKSKLLRS